MLAWVCVDTCALNETVKLNTVIQFLVSFWVTVGFVSSSLHLCVAIRGKIFSLLARPVRVVSYVPWFDHMTTVFQY